MSGRILAPCVQSAEQKPLPDRLTQEQMHAGLNEVLGRVRLRLAQDQPHDEQPDTPQRQTA